MRQPLMVNRRRAPTSRSTSMPSPVKGWNAKDALADMDPASAIILDNVFPNPDEVTLRRGMESHATGLGAAVETLAQYAGPTTRALLAAAGGSIYDASSAGAIGSALTSGKTGNRWQTSMFATSGGNFLYMVNGVDDAIYYDGASFTTPTLTGVSSSDLIGVMAHRARLFFIVKDSLKFGYLPINSVAGTITTFELGNLNGVAGKLKAMGSWTRDGGSGPDDVACFITSTGQVVLFTGSDPGDADDWSHIGTFQIGAPIGDRAVLKLGADLVVMTQDGFVPLSRVLPIDRMASQGQYLSDNIQAAVSAATRSYGTNFGWQCLFYPGGNMGVFNVPLSASVSHQYVVNTLTGAWSRFTGWNAKCWTPFNERIYFGAPNGKVYLADTGVSDDGMRINGDIKPAFNYFGAKGQKKLFTLVRPLMRSNGAIPIAIDLNVDYENISPSSVPTAPEIDAAQWDVAKWDEAVWGADDSLVAPWIGVSGIGHCATPRMRVSTSEMTFSLAGFDVVWQPGAAM